MKRVPAGIYVASHATAPFVSAAHIRECVRMVQSGRYDSAFTAERLQRLMWKDNRPMNFNAGRIPRTQDLGKIYSGVSAVYVYRREVFTELGRRLGENHIYARWAA